MSFSTSIGELALEPCGVTPRGSRHQASLLVVDDDPAVADALAFLLVGEGYGVEVACDADSALAALARRGFDAILTDLSMPGGGRRWLAYLRAKFPRLPVIVITALDREAAAFATPARLADAVLGKPVEAEALVHLLDRIVSVGRP